MLLKSAVSVKFDKIVNCQATEARCDASTRKYFPFLSFLLYKVSIIIRMNKMKKISIVRKSLLNYYLKLKYINSDGKDNIFSWKRTKMIYSFVIVIKSNSITISQ